jgi:hypothetical protein
MFEHVFRSGARRVPATLALFDERPTVDQLLATPAPSTLADVLTLTEAVRGTHALALCGQPFVSGPVFGSESVGADGDLLLGSTLIDVKTSNERGLRASLIYQLVGYLLLDEDDTHEIASLGYYKARAPALLTWPADELLQMLARRPISRQEARARFEDALSSF